MIDRQRAVDTAAAGDVHTTPAPSATSSFGATEATIGKAINMPGKQVVASSDVIGVEELVHEIKENLRLKARPSHVSRNTRPSPYHIPCRSWSDTATSTCDKQQLHKPKKEELDDPYELLQTLLKSNNLVKEAVRRLQLNYSPKQRMFYDSDEESRSPIIRMCQLEL